MVDPALTQLNRVLAKPDTSDADRLRPLTAVLDRTGLSAEQVIKELSVTVGLEADPWADLTEGILVDTEDLLSNASVEELEAALRIARAREARQAGDAIPREVVRDECSVSAPGALAQVAGVVRH